jgi:sugar lactone lactonase YvrE
VRRCLAAGLLALACSTAAAPAANAAPGDLAIADEGNLFGNTGRLVTVTPAGAAHVLVSGTPLRNPWAVAVAPDGAMLLADEGAEAIFRVTPAGAVTTVGSGRELDDPVGIALAPGGVAYVSDRNRDAVLRLELANGRITKVADVRDAAGLAFDRAGKLLVTDERVVRRVDPGTGAVTTAAEGAPLDRPEDVAVALDGTMFVIDDARVLRISPTGAKSVLASGAPLDDPNAIDIEPDGDLVVADREGAVIHVDRDTGAKSPVMGGSMLRRPTGIASVGGAGVDVSGGGNGDPEGPAAPPPPPPPVDPGGGGGDTPGTGGGTGGGGTPVPGPGGTTVVRNPDGTFTVTRADGSVVTLPPGVTPATSGIKGVDFVAPGFKSKPRLSATRFRAARRGKAFISVSIGTRIKWALTEFARVTITVQKRRTLSRGCRRARSSRHRTGCRKYVSVKGRYAVASAAGVNSVRFRGRLRGKRLKPGRYRFVIRARDGAGNVSKPKRPTFRIVR